MFLYNGVKKGFPYSIPSVGHGADPGVQAVSPQSDAVGDGDGKLRPGAAT